MDLIVSVPKFSYLLYHGKTIHDSQPSQGTETRRDDV